MHNRRFGAFLAGAWLLGTFLVWLVSTQSHLLLARMWDNPAPSVAALMERGDPEAMRLLLRYYGQELLRRVIETWDVVRLGLAASLLAISVFTAHRSYVAVSAATVMLALSIVSALVVTPELHAHARGLDFAAASSSVVDRESLLKLEVWRRVLGIVATLAALVVSARLLFDFYEFSSRKRRAA